MMNDIIEAIILNVKFKGEDVLLPRIPMILTDMSFEFKRLRLAFAMTINKAQGHRYKYVDKIWKIHTSHMENCIKTCSRVVKPSDLFVYTPEGKTKNIVYSKALHKTQLKRNDEFHLN
jgi:ATP-dependent DNA helicase PIF1